MRKHIQVVPYNPEWPIIFEGEAEKIKSALADNCIVVHHIGSTSVPGLAAKPTIDIILVVKDLKKSIHILELLDFTYKGEYNIPMRLFFSRNEEMDFHVHVCQENNTEIELNLLFRNYLRDHPEARNEYAKLKENLLSHDSSHEKNNSLFGGYTLGKDLFIRAILKHAGFNNIRLMRCTHYNEWNIYHRIKGEQIFAPVNVLYDRNHPSLTAENHFHFVLYKGVEIVSIAHVEFLYKDEAAIRVLATEERYKNQGFAKKMLELLERWIKFSGKNIIKLHSRLSAENFYRKLGYIEMIFNDQSISKDTIDLGKKL